MTKFYFDNSATTALSPSVIKAVTQELKAAPHNPSSVHFLGQEAKALLSDCRDTLARLFGLKKKNILFTSGATEALNLAIRSLCYRNRGKRVITTKTEHPAVLNTLEALQQEGCITIDYLPVTLDGKILFEEPVDPDSFLAIFSHVNSETGALCNVKEAATFAKKSGLFLLIDSSASIGKVPIENLSLSDGFVVSAHKIHGPKGSGLLVMKDPSLLSAQITGGGQEFYLRSGTENLPAIIGLTLATKEAIEHQEENHRHLFALQECFETLLCGLGICEKNINTNRSSHISNLYFPDFSAETLLIQMNQRGICASSGSACNSGSLAPSHVLMGMGYSQQRVLHSIRFSFSIYNTIEEVEEAARIISKLCDQMHSSILLSSR